MKNEKKESPKPKKKQPDQLKNIKYLGYCRALTPPGEGMTLKDLVIFARFFLCKQNHRLWKDPIWDDYTEEEILVEYFAHLFSTNEEKRREFETQLDAGPDIYGEDIYDWFDKKVKENQEEMEKQADEMVDTLDFSPETNVDKER